MRMRGFRVEARGMNGVRYKRQQALIFQSSIYSVVYQFIVMNRMSTISWIRWRGLPLQTFSCHRLFSRLSPMQTHHHHQLKQQHQTLKDKSQSHESKYPEPEPEPASILAIPQSLSTLNLPFWTCRETWKRAGINTLRCLVGCTSGDFSSMWVLQTYFPEIGMGVIMAVSSNVPPPSFSLFPFLLAKYMS